jgi:hypothetical protein
VSALAEALVAAQRRAITQLEKVYVAGGFEDARMHELLDAMGCADAVDQDHLIAALDTIRAYGGPLPNAPANGGEAKPPEKASDAQLALIADLVKRKNLTAPDLPLTKVDASAIITSMQSDTYDAAKWQLPF